MSLRPNAAAQEAAQHVRRHPIETLGRVGYAVKGVVYVLLGALALGAARGGGAPEDQTGALQALAATPFGSVLLGIVAVGLLAYALWRLALAGLDPEGRGRDAEGLARRAGDVISAVAHGALAYTAYRILTGAGADGGSVDERTATLMSQPFGPWLVGAVGLGIIGYGLVELYRASTASFMDELVLDGKAAANRDTVRKVGQAGLAARGVVYGIIGGFLVVAAYQSDPEEARGLDGALRALQEQTFGPVLLALVALGLAGYGVYCVVYARYGRFEGRQ